MGLGQYRRKRDFSKTPEPRGEARRRAGAARRFVVQRHAARRLHYDFRLELDGVLKSWAIPKGPSLDPGERRLAVHVEDHPLDYGDFEGVIPQGQYGGGTVMLWDRGSWIPEDADAAAAYRNGSLKFRLEGEKLTGNWALVRMGGRAARERRENWLLIKERDAAAVPGSGGAVTEENPRSVASGREMAAIARDADRVWDSAHGEVAPDTAEKPAARKRKAARTVLPDEARPGPLPARPRPLLATAARAAPAGEDWLHEIKFDGYRILARVAGRRTTLFSRNGLDWTARFPEIATALARLPCRDALIDGEATALDKAGRTAFSALQDALSRGDTAGLVYFAFDLLHCDGRGLTAAPLEARKEALRRLLGEAGSERVRFSDHQIGRGPEFLAVACAHGLEGIVSKQRNAPYASGRSRRWLKVKCGQREELAIIGFTDPAGARQGFGALLLGYYDDAGRLHYAGRVGTGFDARRLEELRRQLDRDAVAKRPVERLPKGVSTRDVHWVRPTLVAEIRFAEWTRDGILRQAAFLGLREDKSAEEVVLDPARTGSAAPPPCSPPQAGENLGGGRRDRVRERKVRLTNAEKRLWPSEGITKGDLAAYYESVAERALPHLAGRPLAIVRAPDGLAGERFFQKHVTGGMPAAIHPVDVGEGGASEPTISIADAEGLVALAQIGALEIHCWGATARNLERPDLLTFDLDPDSGLPWERMIEAALATKALLAELGLESFPKATGGKGLHLVVPVAPRLAWAEAKAFAKAAAERLVAAVPERFTANMSKRARRGKIFVDYLRNGRGATAIGVFSTRARPGATVAAPLSWAEIEGGMRSDAFTLATLPQRLAAETADPWAGFFAVKQGITAAARRKLRMA